MAPSQESFKAEIANQIVVLERMLPTRMLTSAVAYSIMAVFLSPWLCALAYILDLSTEWLTIRLMRNLGSPRPSPRYLAVIAVTVITEMAACVPAVLIWQLDQGHAKALAVGLLCITSFQIANTKSVFLPIGLAALGTALVVTLSGNAYYWLGQDEYPGLLISTAGIFAACLYTGAAMISNHRLHRELTRRGEAAQAASHAKSQFIAQISHELRTPLNAIIGMGTAEQIEATVPASAERMKVLIAAAKGLAVVLDDILDISALDGKGVTIRPLPVDPTEEIAITLQLFRPQFEAAELQLTLECSPSLPEGLLLDPARLRQCLSNLLSNALKFTSSGQVAVSAAMRGAQIQIDVSDTGCGIGPEEAKRLFEPFQRGEGAQTGMGLGLAISRALARQMGGDLLLVPTAQGAHFRLVVLTGRTAAPPVAAAAPSRIERSFQVLVVDDIATNRLVAATYLGQLGVQVSEASSGAEALEVISSAPPDLVLLDMNMPQMSGIECLSALRRIGPRGMPVLAMTASADLAHQKQWAALGLDGFLAKPLSAESIFAALSPYLSNLPGTET
jgi:signal transduction histidine kinase/ActR/RegA family two-component response regulator